MSNQSTFLSDAVLSDAVLAAVNLAKSLQRSPVDRLVLAESCTAGLVSALLGQIPGISEFLCGSAVTYRESVKQQWLGVSPMTLAGFTAESIQTTNEMAIGVLRSTDEATLSAAVTGHLGPGAPAERDGNIFVSIACRNAGDIVLFRSEEYQLVANDRVERQYESAKCVFELLLTARSRLR